MSTSRLCPPSSTRTSHAAHRQIDARHQILLFDLQGHLLGRSSLAHREQAAGVESRQFVAGGGNQPLHRFCKAAGTDRRPVVVAKAHSAPHKVVRDLQIIVVRAVQVGEVDRRRIWKGEIADRIVLGEHDGGASIPHLGLQRRGGGRRNKEAGEGPQEPRGGNVEFGFEFVEMLVAALVGGKVHEIPGKQRIRQGQVRVNTGRRQAVAVKVDAFLQIAALGDAPVARDRIVADLGQKQKLPCQ